MLLSLTSSPLCSTTDIRNIAGPSHSMSSVDTPSPTAATTTAEGSIERNDDPTLNAVDQLLQQLQSHDTAVVDHENPFHEWADSDWSVLKSNAHAFARSIQTAEAELNQRHQPDHTNITSPSAAATHAFEQWANRIAHLHILDVSRAPVAASQRICVSSHCSHFSLGKCCVL